MKRRLGFKYIKLSDGTYYVYHYIGGFSCTFKTIKQIMDYFG